MMPGSHNEKPVSHPNDGSVEHLCRGDLTGCGNADRRNGVRTVLEFKSPVKSGISLVQYVYIRSVIGAIYRFVPQRPRGDVEFGVE